MRAHGENGKTRERETWESERQGRDQETEKQRERERVTGRERDQTDRYIYRQTERERKEIGVQRKVNRHALTLAQNTHSRNPNKKRSKNRACNVLSQLRQLSRRQLRQETKKSLVSNP